MIAEAIVRLGRAITPKPLRPFVKAIVSRSRSGRLAIGNAPAPAQNTAIAALADRDPVLSTHPAALTFELTNHCQLRCVTCPLQSPDGQELIKGFMPFDGIKKVLDECRPHLQAVGLSGLGESLLHPRFVDIVKYIRAQDKRMNIFLATNAGLPQKLDVMEEVIDLLDTVMISIDGMDAAYETVRVRANYDVFAENVANIQKLSQGKRASVILNMVAVKENFHQMADIVKLASDLDIHTVGINAANLIFLDWGDEYYNFYFEDEFKTAFDKAKKLADEAGIILNADYFPNVEAPKGFKHCPYPWDQFDITWEGFLALCCVVPFPKIQHFGNVFQDGLLNCINHPDFIEIRKQHQRNITPESCKNCGLITEPIVQRYKDSHSA